MRKGQKKENPRDHHIHMRLTEAELQKVMKCVDALGDNEKPATITQTFMQGIDLLVSKLGKTE